MGVMLRMATTATRAQHINKMSNDNRVIIMLAANVRTPHKLVITTAVLTLLSRVMTEKLLIRTRAEIRVDINRSMTSRKELVNWQNARPG